MTIFKTLKHCKQRIQTNCHEHWEDYRNEEHERNQELLREPKRRINYDVDKRHERGERKSSRCMLLESKDYTLG